MIHPGRVGLTQFISQDKYEEIKNIPDKEIDTSYKFVQRETSSGKPRIHLQVQTPFLSFSGFINTADREKLKSIFNVEVLKEGQGFSFGKLWEMIKKYGMKILSRVPQFMTDIKDLGGDATKIRSGRRIGDRDEQTEQGKCVANLAGKG